MNFKKEYFFCSPRLLKNIPEIEEIDTCIDNINWRPEYEIEGLNPEEVVKELLQEVAVPR